MMSMVAVCEHRIHNGWQYTNVNQIWQYGKMTQFQAVEMFFHSLAGITDCFVK